MALQRLPRSAELYGAEQRTEIRAAVAASLRLWRRMGTEFDQSYALIEPSLLRVADAAQERVAAGAQEYIPAVLAETGQARAVAPRFDVNATSLVGTAGDGLPTDGLLYGAVTHTKSQVAAGRTPNQALASGSQWLSTAMGTLLSDTGRASELLAMQARPVSGYVRMLEPPSCGRCVVLAGKWSRLSVAFPRHPKCDCRNIPSSESDGMDLTVNPREYFDQLDEAAQNKMMGSKANADAVREHGADQAQIINAYRKALTADGYVGGIQSAQVFGRNVRYTTEGTTRRGFAYSRMRRARSQSTPRLMPESIAQIATSKADQERLLRLYGWVR